MQFYIFSGDLGHVTSIIHPQVEEGDCRYLPQEILHEEFDHLQKADIFSLALTVLEAVSVDKIISKILLSGFYISVLAVLMI